MSLLCTATGCATWGYHVAGCQAEPECRGCRPREAADGLRLCLRDSELLATHARKAAENHEALLLVLGGRGGWLRETVSGSRDRGLTLNLGAASARYEIEEHLGSWAVLIGTTRGHDTSGLATLDSVAEFVAINARWLAAQPLAAEAFDDLKELATGLPWRAAYPGGQRPHTLGRCPVDECRGEITAEMTEDGEALDYVVCGLAPAHRWTREDLFRLWPRLVELADPPALTTSEAALVLGVSVGSVRRFAMAGRLARDGGGYDAESVVRLRMELWPEGIPHASGALRLSHDTHPGTYAGTASVPRGAKAQAQAV